jgi:hypothetical protein
METAQKSSGHGIAIGFSRHRTMAIERRNAPDPAWGIQARRRAGFLQSIRPLPA